MTPRAYDATSQALHDAGFPNLASASSSNPFLNMILKARMGGGTGGGGMFGSGMGSAFGVQNPFRSNPALTQAGLSSYRTGF